MRGTDKGTAHSPPELMRIVKPEEYFPEIDAYTEEHGPCRILIGTDQDQFVDRMRERYGDRVVSRDAIRARGVRNPFEIQDGQGYRKGEDVLIDCLLLSRCDHLLKCTSAVGEFALYFEPALPCVAVNLAERRMSVLDSLGIRLKRRLYLMVLNAKGLVYRWHTATWTERTLGRWPREEPLPPLYHDLLCRSGFGNRLTDLWGAVTIASLTHPGAKLAVHWARSGNRYPGFVGRYSTQLFSVEGCDFVARRPRGSLAIESPHDDTRLEERCWVPVSAETRQLVLRSGRNWGNNCPDRLYGERRHYGLADDIGAERLAPAYRVAARGTKPAAEVEAGIPADIEKRVGVHVRLTDKLVDEENAFEMSCDTWRAVEERGMRCIERCIAWSEPFFVCSDDREYRDRLVARIRDMCGDVVTASPRRGEPGLEAIVDFFALSRSLRIVQMTKYSTFSTAAALAGDVPLVNCCPKDSPAGHRIDIWKSVLPALSSAEEALLEELDS
jgi:hypothetical protein